MSSDLYLYASIALLVMWVAFLTFFYITAVRHYKQLSIKEDESLEDAINVIFSGLKDLDIRNMSLKERINSIEEDSVKYVQKVAMKRFNPFGDTGGDQSFSVTFLDDNDDGIVLSSLHGRSGTRLYGKPVESGGYSGYELSQEEKDIIKLAMEGNKDGK